MVWHTVPKIIQRLFPKRVWEVDKEQNSVFLTFDDGPVPGVTDFVLEELDKRGQKANFFMVGANVQKHAELAKAVITSGHRIGNHTFNHLNGWKSTDADYLKNVEECQVALNEIGVETKLFRPPYGMMKRSQAKELGKTYKLIMWSMLSGDYNPRLDPDLVLNKSIKFTKPGRIMVFHDQQKTRGLLPKILPTYLDFIEDQGWKTGLL